MIDFVKIRGAYVRFEHILAISKVKSFYSGARKIEYVVRLSEDAAGGDNPKFQNRWCTAREVEPLLRRIRGLTPLPEDIELDETSPVSSDEASEVK